MFTLERERERKKKPCVLSFHSIYIRIKKQCAKMRGDQGLLRHAGCCPGRETVSVSDVLQKDSEEEMQRGEQGPAGVKVTCREVYTSDHI